MGETAITMGTALGGASVVSPGDTTTDSTAPAATTGTPADLTSTTEPQSSKSDTVARSEYEKSVLAERNLRARLKVYEDEKTAAEQAALSDAQKLTKQLEKVTAEAAQFKSLYAEALTQYQAKELGFQNAELGASLVMKGLEFGDDGKPTNAKDLLTALLKTDSYLAAGSTDDGKQQPPTVANLGATNGGGGKAGQPTLDDFRKGKLTMEDSARMWADGSMARMLEAENAKRR